MAEKWVVGWINLADEIVFALQDSWDSIVVHNKSWEDFYYAQDNTHAVYYLLRKRFNMGQKFTR